MQANIGYTTAERDARNWSDGDVILNTTLGKLQLRQGGVWIDNPTNAVSNLWTTINTNSTLAPGNYKLNATVSNLSILLEPTAVIGSEWIFSDTEKTILPNLVTIGTVGETYTDETGTYVTGAFTLDVKGSGFIIYKTDTTKYDILPINVGVEVNSSGGLTIENSAGTVLGVASKQRFSAEFVPTWDGANSRITVALAAGLGVQVGTVVYDAFDTVSNPAVPAGYLLCNGQTVDGDNALYTALRTRLQSQFITNVEINRPVLPFLTSNTLPSGYVASSSTQNGANAAFRAFDDTVSATFWGSSIWSADSTPPTVGGEWVQLETQSAINVTGFTILRDQVVATTTYDYKVQYKLNVGDSWTDIGTYTNAPATNTVTFAQITGRYFRILITRVNSSGGGFANIGNFSLRLALLSPIRYFQVPNLSNLATGIRPIIKI